MPRDMFGHHEEREPWVAPPRSTLHEAADRIRKRLDSLTPAEILVEELQENYGPFPVVRHSSPLGYHSFPHQPSAHYIVDHDSITDTSTGERITMATDSLRKDLANLTDEELRAEQSTLNREARRRADEMSRRTREAARNQRPSFDKFHFEAQYRNVPGGRQTNPSIGIKKYEYLGMILPDGRVFLTGGTRFTSWARFVDWVNGDLRWISKLQKVNVSTKTGPSREYTIPMLGMF